MRYLSVCSGIEAASVAWHPLGWTAVGFAEIDKFASAVLAERFGSNLPGQPLTRNGVPNHGDFTAIDVASLPSPIDLLVGGTPCQAFSFAGKRLSLADARGNLTLAYAVLAHELARSHGLRNALWENVPGVLSTEDNAFGCFLGALVGADDALPLPRGVERWPDAGMVAGPRARAAWRILDAQYFGLAQRRERVFVVVDFGNGADPAAVLFEPKGMSGNSPPRRETGERVAPTLAARVNGGGGLGTDFDLDGGLTVTSHEIAQPLLAKGNCSMRADAESYIAHAFGGNNCGGPIEVSTAINAHGGPAGRLDFESETFIAHTLRGEGFDASEDGTGRGTPIVAVPFDTTQITSKGNYSRPQAGDPCHPLASTAHPPTTIAFTCKDYGGDAQDDLSPTLRAGGFTESHANAGVMPAIAFMPTESFSSGNNIEISPTLRVGTGIVDRGEPPAVAYDMRGRDGGAQFEGPHYTANIHAANGGSSRSYVQQHGWAVRRLTPIECARLQGFPDRHSQIPWGNKPAEQCPDGNQYKTFGNSMAVKVMRWLGERLARFMPTVGDRSIPQHDQRSIEVESQTP